MEPEGPQMTIWRMRVAYWISEATRAPAHTHTHMHAHAHPQKYVITMVS